MVNKYLVPLLLVLCLTGCEKSIEEQKAEVARLEARQAKLNTVVQKYESQRDAAREEIARLRIEKGGLEAPDTNFPPVKAMVTNIVYTNIVVVTNIVSTFDSSPDGRCAERINIANWFQSQEVFTLPYSPHEHIVKSSNKVYYAWADKVGTNVNALLLFK